MSQCGQCERSIPDGSNFCPACGAPQNERAARALYSFTKERLEEMSPADREEILEGGSIPGGSSLLEQRVSTAVGWLTIVTGLVLLPSLASVALVLAGVVVLPPTRRVLSIRFDLPVSFRGYLGIYGMGIVVAAALFLLV